MTKLKTLLEGFAWERKADGSLPTLAEVQAEYEKNEAVSQSDADKRWNTDPIQMSMRKNTMPADSVLASSMSTPAKAPSNFYREKITALEAQRKQLEFDMEQEAEPEGGPIADYYGEALMHIDDQIASIRKKMSTNESLDTVNEESNPIKAKIAKLEKELANVKHQYYKDSNLSAEKSEQLRKKMGDLGRDLKRAKREDKTGSAGYQKTSKAGTTEPRWQDNDGDGKWYEPGDDVKAESAKPDYIDADGDGNETESMKKAFRDKEEMNESFISRIKKNLIGGATRK
jgi:hypothetical protein